MNAPTDAEAHMLSELLPIPLLDALFCVCINSMS